MHDMDSLPFVTPVYKRDLTIENYFIGYLQAPLHLVLHRARLQIALHLLPVAADGRRPPLPHAQRRPRHRRDPLLPVGLSAGQGILLRRRHLHRRSAARRGDRPRARQARRHLVVQRQGQRAARDPEGPEGQRPAPAPRRLRIRQPADPAQHQEGHAHRGGGALHQGLPRARHHHPRHLHHGPAGRDEGDDRGDDPLRHARSTRIPSRSRSRRPIPAPSSTSRRSRTAGSIRPMRNWSTPTACRSRRCITTISPTPRSSSRSSSSTGASISARRRSPPSSARWCAAPR